MATVVIWRGSVTGPSSRRSQARWQQPASATRESVRMLRQGGDDILQHLPLALRGSPQVATSGIMGSSMPVFPGVAVVADEAVVFDQYLHHLRRGTELLE